MKEIFAATQVQASFVAPLNVDRIERNGKRV